MGGIAASCASPQRGHELGIVGVTPSHVEGSCDKVTGSYEVRTSADNVRVVKRDDRELLEARAQAGRTIGYFVGALRAPTARMSEFKIKARFAEGPAAENMWVAKLRFDGAAFSGELDNDPQDLREIKAGDPVTIPRDRVQDWLFVDGDRLMGAFTLRYFLRRMTRQSCQKTLAAFRVRRLGPWQVPMRTGPRPGSVDGGTD